MDGNQSDERLLLLLDEIRTGPSAGGEPDLVGLRWSVTQWRRLLLDLPRDSHSFAGRYEQSWDTVIADLERWWTGRRGIGEGGWTAAQRRTVGYVGLLLVTLISLRHTDAYRRQRGPRRGGRSRLGGAVDDHDCAATCAVLLAEPAVREALRTVYAPAGPDDQDLGDPAADALSRAEWDRIDFDTVRFHRHGTTSFILAGSASGAVQGRQRMLALKCILYPYLRVPTIARATREYFSRYGVPGRDVEHLARVWACGTSWILMDFVAGQTLADYLDRQLADPPATAAVPKRGRAGRRPAGKGRAGREAEIELPLLDGLGEQLFAALADLERAGLHHGDLSPSNIMVQPRRDGTGVRFVLIDLGVNYLYVHAMPGFEGPDSAFVAPEISSGNRSTQRADLFSVGHLLILISGVAARPDGAVPDDFYADTPVMARFIEDLVDSEPDRRLLIFEPDGDRPLYPQLREFFHEELTALTAVAGERVQTGGPAWLISLINIFQPLAGAPGRQRRMWRIRRMQRLYRDPRRGMYVRWLLLWSWVSAAAWYVAAAVVVTWWLRDLGWDWGNQVISVLQRAAGADQDEFPYLDALRAPDYPIPDPAGNTPIRMVGMSFLLVGARYYQNLFAGLTPLGAGLQQGRLSLLAVLAEIQMRLFSIMAFVLVLPPTLIQRAWWPIFTATGILFTFLCNWTCLSFAKAALARAMSRSLSTVPADRIVGVEDFSDWTPSAGFYAAATWVIGLMVYFGLVRDIYVYAAAVAAINTVLFYMIKCSGDNAAAVRVGLARAFLAAERLRYLHGPRVPLPRESATDRGVLDRALGHPGTDVPPVRGRRGSAAARRG